MEGWNLKYLKMVSERNEGYFYCETAIYNWRITEETLETLYFENNEI